MPNSSPCGIQFSKSIHEPHEHEVLRLNLNKVTESITTDKTTINAKIISATQIRVFLILCTMSKPRYGLASGILLEAGLTSAVLHKRRLHSSSQQANADKFTQKQYRESSN
ncbi:hypothetical protein GQX74_008694 [Glossina fuscipes]|nr:hypothetical protein GQX74_008694 [Glossina fuscipes]